jgi:hypothetical protein
VTDILARMTRIDLHLDGDECWPDIAELSAAGKLDEAALVGVALLPDAEVTDVLTGQTRRVPAISLRIALPDGRVGLAQMKVDMLRTIVRALDGRLAYIADLAARGGTSS